MTHKTASTAPGITTGEALRSGTVTDPTAAGPPVTPVGAPPFWSPGEVFVWHYRRRTWAPGMPEDAYPMRVVRDDERGLVGWLAGGTVGLRPRRADGTDIRADKTDMFTAPRRQSTAEWYGGGILRIAPAGRPWSVWVFHDEHGFSGWYVNLEDPARRSGHDLVASDLVLDIRVLPDRVPHRKDEDELLLAVEQGRFSGAEAAEITGHADRAEESVAAGDWPFEDEWVRWRAPQDWPAPVLPASFGI